VVDHGFARPDTDKAKTLADVFLSPPIKLTWTSPLLPENAEAPMSAVRSPVAVDGRGPLVGSWEARD
jgi:hypothetical protein